MASSPSAAASSLSVFNASGELSTKLDTAVSVYVLAFDSAVFALDVASAAAVAIASASAVSAYDCRDVSSDEFAAAAAVVASLRQL